MPLSWWQGQEFRESINSNREWPESTLGRKLGHLVPWRIPGFLWLATWQLCYLLIPWDKGNLFLSLSHSQLFSLLRLFTSFISLPVCEPRRVKLKNWRPHLDLDGRILDFDSRVTVKFVSPKHSRKPVYLSYEQPCIGGIIRKTDLLLKLW